MGSFPEENVNNRRGWALGSGKLHTDGEMATSSPITQQICSSLPPTSSPTSPTPSPIPTPIPSPILEVEDCLIYDRHGVGITFKSLYQNHKAIIIFVRSFLCYTCQEYVEDLSKIPQEMLVAFCSLTGYQHEMYVDPERRIYKKLGMARGEIYEEKGDLLQQGGAFIIGPGPSIHVAHFDMNRFNHMPIDDLLQLAGVQVVNFNRHAKIIHI
ncbi:peroxiredoxin-like 2C isoform X4 [Tachysurus fulvidraco]|uniref:peroxiredoxin-like 2C isoform X4 n=1 Tax=Tachysurus fulvidraco TaxID=1234273 RepID=UPI001FEF69A3|nr:peroxiredoxin-like 2C isoform X4 [Tachysurus fulvidraco]